MEAPDGLAVLFNTEETANIWTSALLVYIRPRACSQSKPLPQRLSVGVTTVAVVRSPRISPG